MKTFRVEATVPAIQYVQAATEEDAKRVACETPDAWEVDLDAPIELEHVVSVEEQE